MITVPLCPHCDGPEPAEPCHHCGRSTIPEIPPYDRELWSGRMLSALHGARAALQRGDAASAEALITETISGQWNASRGTTDEKPSTPAHTRIVVVLDFVGTDAEAEAFSLVNSALNSGVLQVEIHERGEGDVSLIDAIVSTSGNPSDVPAPTAEEIAEEIARSRDDDEEDDDVDASEPDTAAEYDDGPGEP